MPLTGRWTTKDPAGNVFAGLSGGVAAGSVSVGGDVGAWQSQVDSNHVWIPQDRGTFFGPPDITLAAAGVLRHPSIAIEAGSMIPVLASGPATQFRQADLLTLDDLTLLLAFALTSDADLTNHATLWLNTVFFGQEQNNYWGTHIRNTGSAVELLPYNWDGTGDPSPIEPLVVTVNTRYVYGYRRVSGTAYVTLVSLTATASLDFPTGTTQANGVLRLADSNPAGTQQVRLNIGQIDTYDEGLDGATWDAALAVMVAEWLTGTSASTRLDWLGGTRIAGGVPRYETLPSGFTPGQG